MKLKTNTKITYTTVLKSDICCLANQQRFTLLLLSLLYCYYYYYLCTLTVLHCHFCIILYFVLKISYSVTNHNKTNWLQFNLGTKKRTDKINKQTNMIPQTKVACKINTSINTSSFNTSFKSSENPHCSLSLIICCFCKERV